MQDRAEAIKWYSKVGEQGHTGALKWIQREAEQGLADAQYQQGSMLEYGHGVRQNVKKAFNWYKKAAEQGFVEAQYALGRIYERGAGIKFYRPYHLQLFTSPETDRQSIAKGLNENSSMVPYRIHTVLKLDLVRVV